MQGKKGAQLTVELHYAHTSLPPRPTGHPSVIAASIAPRAAVGRNLGRANNSVNLPGQRSADGFRVAQHTTGPEQNRQCPSSQNQAFEELVSWAGIYTGKQGSEHGSSPHIN